MEAVFVFHRGGEAVTDFKKAWRAARKAAGPEDRLVHDLRRTAVRNMIRAGVPERIAMEVSGHKTRAVFDRYNIVNEQDVREAMRRVQRYVDEQPAKASRGRLAKTNQHNTRTKRAPGRGGEVISP